MSDVSLPPVSIVVPTRNRPRFLQETLSSLLRQDFPADHYEIVVVDDGSDPPVDVPDGVQLVRHDRPRGPNAARNTGVRTARYDVISLVDDDIDAPTDWLRNVACGLARHPNAWCFGGPIRLRVEDVTVRLCRRCKASTLDTELDTGDAEGATSAYVYGANMGALKPALVAAGPFDEEIPQYYEELEWQDRVRKAGGEIVYLPDAWLWHRRTCENMRFRTRLLRRFKGGRGFAHYMRSQDCAVPFGVGFIRSLAHAVLRRCPGGLLYAATEIGKLVGVIEFEYIRWRSRFT